MLSVDRDSLQFRVLWEPQFHMLLTGVSCVFGIPVSEVGVGAEMAFQSPRLNLIRL